MRLTRRERAAMELCLHVLRSDVRRYYDRVPTWGDLCSYLEILEWGSYGLTESMHPVPYYDGTPRLMYRARLALYLRARLRADRGDCATREVTRCDVCGRGVSDHASCCMCGSADYIRCPCEPRMSTSRRPVRPLWETCR